MTIVRHIIDPATGQAFFVTPNNPSTVGLDGPLGSLANLSGGGRLFTKFGSAITDWSEVAMVGASGGVVNSVFGRTGDVIAQANDYTFAQIGSKPTTIAGYGITDFNTLGDARYARLTGAIFSGQVAVGTDTSAAEFILNGPIGTNKLIRFRTGGSTRWAIYADSNSETGSDAGSTFRLQAYTDTGGTIDQPIVILRAAGGNMLLNRPVVAQQGFSTAGGPFTVSTIGAVTTTGTGGSFLWYPRDATADSTLRAMWYSTAGFARLWTATSSDVMRVNLTTGLISVVQGLNVSGGLSLASGTLTLPVGSIADAALSSNIPRLLSANTFTGAQTISSTGALLSLKQSSTNLSHYLQFLDNTGVRRGLVGFSNPTVAELNLLADAGGINHFIPTGYAFTWRINSITQASLSVTGLSVTGVITATGAMTAGGTMTVGGASASLGVLSVLGQSAIYNGTWSDPGPGLSADLKLGGSATHSLIFRTSLLGPAFIFSGGVSFFNVNTTNVALQSGGGTGEIAVQLRTSDGTPRGYLYGNSAGVGFLGSSGQWGLRVPYGTLDVAVGGDVKLDTADKAVKNSLGHQNPWIINGGSSAPGTSVAADYTFWVKAQ